MATEPPLSNNDDSILGFTHDLAAPCPHGQKEMERIVRRKKTPSGNQASQVLRRALEETKARVDVFGCQGSRTTRIEGPYPKWFFFAFSIRLDIGRGNVGRHGQEPTIPSELQFTICVLGLCSAVAIHTNDSNSSSGQLGETVEMRLVGPFSTENEVTGLLACRCCTDLTAARQSGVSGCDVPESAWDDLRRSVDAVVQPIFPQLQAVTALQNAHSHFSSRSNYAKVNSFLFLIVLILSTVQFVRLASVSLCKHTKDG